MKRGRSTKREHVKSGSLLDSIDLHACAPGIVRQTSHSETPD
jgi:hypothetical protein